jgi:predicted transposase YbfD/YdcC
MNTKTFAQQARRLLIDGVAKKLLYWGFDTKGNIIDTPQKVSGGYSFRGDVFDDPNVLRLWESLKHAVQHKTIEVVVEEAAYTWFNRIMALRIMSKNGYEPALLVNAEGLEHTPILLQKARQGQYSFLNKVEQERLKKIIGDYSKDQEAFSMLLVGYCHSNTMLNNIFGKIDDYTELLLPDNMLQDSGFLHLLNTTDAISDAEYQEVELIGWLYQFYISEKKDDVFKSFKKGKKAEAKDIPAATQIFTPNWIVKYMVQNTAGKIWLDKHPNSPLRASMKYLVENESDSINSVSSSAERIENKAIINNVEELTLIDPAAGSGHILVEGFDLLFQMYKEEYYTPEEAVESILKNNLFGLDLDDRAAQLATFAILLKAAKYYRDVFTKGWLPNVYAMPEEKNFSQQEVKDFLGTDGIAYTKELDAALRLMKQAKNLGSVMKLSVSEEAQAFIEKRFSALKNTEYQDINLQGIFQSIKTYIPVLLLLTKKYTSVVANPPYLASKNYNRALKEYVESNYPMTKLDLFAVFMEVISDLGHNNSKRGLINQWVWMCIDSYKKYRPSFIKSFHIESLLHLGIGVFRELNTKSVQNVAIIFTNSNENLNKSVCYKIDESFDINEKERQFLNNENRYEVDLSVLKSIPGSPLAFWFSPNIINSYKKGKVIEDIFKSRAGLQTGDNSLFVRNWHEVNSRKIGYDFPNRIEAAKSGKKWFPYNKGGGYNKWFGNNYYVVNWGNDGQDLRNDKLYKLSIGKCLPSNSQPKNVEFYFREGITWSLISLNFSARYSSIGNVFDIGGSSGFPSEEDLLYSIALLNSKVASYILNGLNFTLNVQVGDIKRILFINPEISFKNKIEDISKSLIKLSKKDFDYTELSSDFQNHILISNKKETFQDSFNSAINEIIETSILFYNQEKQLNIEFNELYCLQDVINPSPNPKFLTIFQEYILSIKVKDNQLKLDIDREYIVSSAINYFIGLFMGRYRLDQPGLNIAHPNPTVEELTGYSYNKGKVVIDEDAILPLMGKNCNFSDDALQQINQLLDTIWGHETRTENTNFIQECLDKELEKFLIKDFYNFHCGMYQKKPIYWLFSSKTGAFQVLVYMHRMNAFTVEKIRANYMLEHLKNLRSEESMLQANSATLNTQDAKRLDQIRKDLIECEAFDMELKNVADQQITFDLDDGVTANYAKFESVLAKIK